MDIGDLIYSVSEVTVTPQPTAVIAAETTWEAFPQLWRSLLDQVWPAVRSSAEITPNRNVMLYSDDVPNVEVGVEVGGPFAPIGAVIPSSLPGGRVATTTHRGGYEAIGLAHRAVIDWCDRHGVERTGMRWEIYGHATPRTEDQEVEIYYLLR